MREVTVVLDDDPTGSQEATGVDVLLAPDRARLIQLLRERDAVYVLTNTRALVEADAVALLERLRDDIAAAEAELGVRALVVQRGDSTLRGHVFAEIDVFRQPGDVVVLTAAFPAGGRVTVGGAHLVRIDGEYVNAADTEFAGDPVFGYSARTMVGYVREMGDRDAVSIAAGDVASAPAGSVVVPDVASGADIELVAHGVRALIAAGQRVIVRCAAPLAAVLAGVKSRGSIRPEPIDGPVLVVAGSHTGMTTTQLEHLLAEWPALVELDTDLVMADPARAVELASTALRAALSTDRVAVLATARQRRAEHGTIEDAARVMSALTATVAAVRDLPSAVIAKGGITSAEVATTGLGATVGHVLGQVQPGISLWDLDGLPYVVVPGNMGSPGTLRELVAEFVR